MSGNITGISSYQQANQIYKNSQSSTSKTTQTTKADQSAKSSDAAAKAGSLKGIDVQEWKPISSTSSLVPTVKDGYGTVVGDVQLSDKAQKYYDQLKGKFHGMDFVLVSKDMKKQVEANAASYGNANKPVVLIDDEKIERMANDEAYRKKYEGIIAMSQNKLAQAKQSLQSSGANIMNFGMKVDDDGRSSFFATVENANSEQTKALEKRQAAKKEEKAKEKKKADKKDQEKRLEKRREAAKAEKERLAKKLDKSEDVDDEDTDELDVNEENVAAADKEYVQFKANSLDDLIKKVSKYAYDNSAKTVLAESEKNVGQHFDAKL